MMRMSESTNRVFLDENSAMASHLFLFERRQGGKRLHLERLGLVREHRRAQTVCVGYRVIGWRLDGTPGRGPDREGELLHPTVAVLDLPGDHSLFLFPEHPDAVAERREVRIAPAVDRMLRA